MMMGHGHLTFPITFTNEMVVVMVMVLMVGSNALQYVWLPEVHLMTIPNIFATVTQDFFDSLYNLELYV